MLRGGKLCGVLAESMYRGTEPEAVVLGVGLNRMPPTAPAEAQPGYAPAALVDLFEDATPAMAEVLADVLQALDHVLRDRTPGGALAGHALVEAFDALDLLRDVQVEAPPHEGIARGITPEGHLRLQTASGEVLLHAGEVHLARRSLT
jgi:biotin-(acetyl-CoA carboxylase) ligase